jgi:tRNA-modifying protein YgfZ
MKSSEMASLDSIGYRSVQDRAGWFDRSSRRRLEIVGPDRAKFLHNLTTNDVKRLAEGSGHESFVTSPQGKVLAYATILSAEDATILVGTDPDSMDALLPHLRKYGVFDDVAIEDASARTFEYHIAGPSSGPILEGLGLELPPEGTLRHRSSKLGGVAVRVGRESPTGRPGLTLIGPIEGAEAVKSALAGADVPELDGATFEALRIEAGTPISGRDVTPGHLPQEVGRDRLAINFVKGCYLGQETVARLDALGHVNRIFKGLRFAGSNIPPAGTPLTFEGKAVGSVTSSAYSPGWGSPIGLGYVRVAQATAGTKLVATIEGVGEVETVVEDLPMIPPASR